MAVTGAVVLGAGAVAGGAWAGAAVGADGAVGPGSAAASAPAKNQFAGRITSATGHWRPDPGRVSVQLGVVASSETTRRMTLTIRGAACGKTRHCLNLSGKLPGSVTRHIARIPDIGASDTVRASGGVTPLGQTSVSGMIEGTGMISRGRETMVLTLTTNRGKLTIRASSPIVPGFTVV